MRLDSLFILIPVALVLVAVAVRAFIWTVDSHQYDDLDAAANSILFDDVDVRVATEEEGNSAESQAGNSERDLDA